MRFLIERASVPNLTSVPPVDCAIRGEFIYYRKYLKPISVVTENLISGGDEIISDEEKFVVVGHNCVGWVVEIGGPEDLIALCDNVGNPLVIEKDDVFSLPTILIYDGSIE